MSELFGRRHHHFDGVGYGKFPTFETMLQPFSVAKFSRLGSLATIGSTLYCVGGILPSSTERDRNSRLVRAYDFNRPGNRWNKSLCRPIGRREMPNLVVFDGKLFVFGGTDDDIDGIPFAEVYDPSLDKWERLPDPPTDIGECQLVTAPLFGLKKIVVAESIDEDHYFYDVTARSWEKVDYPVPAEKFGCSLGLTSPVTVGNTVYGFGSMGAYIEAYDFEQMKWFTGPIKGLDHEPFLGDLFDLSYVPSLLYLGGEHFCLLWSDSLSDDIDQTCFHFTIIHVSKEYDSRGEGAINARVESCQRYLAPGNATVLEAHLLDISLNGDDRKDESSSSVQVIEETGHMLDMFTHQAALVGDA